MLDKLLSPLTTAAPIGVAARSLLSLVLALIMFLSVLGWLTPEQAEALNKTVNDIAGQLPGLLAAVSAFALAVLEAYRIISKSMSDKAAEAGKQIDAKLAPDETVVVKTPAGQSDIVVPAKS